MMSNRMLGFLMLIFLWLFFRNIKSGSSSIPQSALSLVEPLAPQSVTAILPILPSTLGQTSDLLKPFLYLNPQSLQHIIILCPESSVSSVKYELQRTFSSQVATVDMDVSLWPLDSPYDLELDMDKAIFRCAALHVSTEFILLMDSTGLGSVTESSLLALLLNPPNASLPLGPSGLKLVGAFSEIYMAGTTTAQWGTLQPAQYLYPPFILSTSLARSFSDTISESKKDNNQTIWTLFGAYVANLRGDAIGGLKIRPLEHSPIVLDNSPIDPIPDWKLEYPNTYMDKDKYSLTTPMASIDFLFLLPTLTDLSKSTSLICRLLSNATQPRVLVLLYNNNNNNNEEDLLDPDSQGSEPGWTSSTLYILLSNYTCSIKYDSLTASSFTTWLSHHCSPSPLHSCSIHVLFTLPLSSEPLLSVQSHILFSNTTTHIAIPRDELEYTDWIGSLTVEELKHWHTPHISISLTTHNRPASLQRLLSSLSSSLFFGDTEVSDLISIRINIEQDCDEETLRVVNEFEWPPPTVTRRRKTRKNVFVHHRVVHGGLLPAVVESWYPKDPKDDYGLLLEDDVEVSPLFYAWIKMTLLRYRYGTQSTSPYLFGISLYQQKHLELPMEGRQPFNARELFARSRNGDASTPYLSQIPCSWGALYFPDHWAEFHSFLAFRLSPSFLVSNPTIIPSIRSNTWRSSWKRFFIEFAHLKGSVMLYPNFANFSSLSTNHLEPGKHVKAPYHLDKERKEMFSVPLMPLPDAMEGQATGLLQLPGNSLPRLESLPVLNLTGFMTTREELQMWGSKRRLEVLNCSDEDISSPPKLFGVSSLLCIHP